MSTISRVPAVIDALVTNIDAQMTGSLAAVSTSQVWPGPEAVEEMLFLGKTTWEDYRIRTIKAGRKQRDEEFEVEFEVWVLGKAGSTPSNPTTARDRAFAILGEAEDVLADDTRIGLGTAVFWLEIRPKEAAPHVFEKGWAYRIAGTFVCHDRLT